MVATTTEKLLSQLWLYTPNWKGFLKQFWAWTQQAKPGNASRYRVHNSRHTRAAYIELILPWDKITDTGAAAGPLQPIPGITAPHPYPWDVPLGQRHNLAEGCHRAHNSCSQKGLRFKQTLKQGLRQKRAAPPLVLTLPRAVSPQPRHTTPSSVPPSSLCQALRFYTKDAGRVNSALLLATEYNSPAYCQNKPIMKSENNLSDNACSEGDTQLEAANTFAVQPQSLHLGHRQTGSDRCSTLIKKH